MAKGRPPKLPHLRLIEGTHRPTRHGDKAEIKKKAAAAVASFGRPEKPAGLKGEALKAWKRFVEPASWLDGSKEPAAIAFCELWQEFLNDPVGFPAAKHTQMRAYMGELGLTDQRNRQPEKEDSKDEFFDD